MAWVAAGVWLMALSLGLAVMALAGGQEWSISVKSGADLISVLAFGISLTALLLAAARRLRGQ